MLSKKKLEKKLTKLTTGKMRISRMWIFSSEELFPFYRVFFCSLENVDDMCVRFFQNRWVSTYLLVNHQHLRHHHSRHHHSRHRHSSSRSSSPTSSSWKADFSPSDLRSWHLGPRAGINLTSFILYDSDGKREEVNGFYAAEIFKKFMQILVLYLFRFATTKTIRELSCSLK